MRAGSVPEVIEDGTTGYIVHTEDEAVAALSKAPLLERKKIRGRFERRFSAAAMAEGYTEIYSRMIGGELRRRNGRDHFQRPIVG